MPLLFTKMQFRFFHLFHSVYASQIGSLSFYCLFTAACSTIINRICVFLLNFICKPIINANFNTNCRLRYVDHTCIIISQCIIAYFYGNSGVLLLFVILSMSLRIFAYTAATVCSISSHIIPLYHQGALIIRSAETNICFCF